jgi:transcriptional regulator with PAS, ATPase and Fis domain
MSELHNVMLEEGITKELLNALPCGLVIIDREGTVLAVNNIMERIFGIKQVDASGVGFGKVFCCIYTDDDEDKYGASEICTHCEIRKLALNALYSNQKKSARVSIQASIRGQIKDLTVLICAAPLKFKDKRLSILTLEDITNLRSLVPRSQEKGFWGIISRDEKMTELFDTIRQIAQTDAPVLIQGESGTGKELVALAIHKESRRAGKHFVPVNCGALPEGLLESELFGHVKGAFTGALYNKKGRFELADGGTIFLDEVAELSPDMQVKFLRVLQDGGFERVGDEKTIKVDTRVICATNTELEKEVADDRFRRDLYYRICVMPVSIPPLRDRSGDIELLANHFLANYCQDSYRAKTSLSSETLSILDKHHWPGNIRELQNILQYALVKCNGTTIKPEHLPGTIFASSPFPYSKHHRKTKISETDVINALRKTAGNKRRAAKILGVSRSTLYRFFDRQRQEDQ